MTQQITSMPRRWVIFWLIVFWPVGLYILIKRMGVDKSALFTAGKTMLITSYVLAGLAVLMVIAAFAPSSEDTSTASADEASPAAIIAVAVVFGIGAAVVNWYARKLLARAERYKTYISLIVNQRQTSIDNIAAAVGTSYDMAAEDLRRMIKLDYFPGAHLDVSQRELVLALPTAPQGNLLVDTAQEPGRIVPCTGCGANNRVFPGRSAECEYCGSPLS